MPATRLDGRAFAQSMGACQPARSTKNTRGGLREMLQAASGSLQNHLQGDFGTHVSCRRVLEGHGEVQSGLLVVGMALLGLPVTGQGVGFCSRAANAQEKPSSLRCQLSAQ